MRRIAILFICALALVAAGCGGGGGPKDVPENAVAVVGDVTVTKAQFDQLIDQAKSETDDAAAAELYNQAEQILLNQDVGVIPMNWYRGDYVYNPDKVQNFEQSPVGIIAYEKVTVTS